MAAGGGRLQGLCNAHYQVAERGYVDAAPVVEHLTTLRAGGATWGAIAERTGLTVQGLLLIGTRSQRVQVATARKIMSVPAPEPFGGDGYVSTIGVHRRIRALMAIGWTQRELETRLQLSHRRLSMVLARKRVRASMARRINALFEELSGTLGPSEKSRRIAVQRGWAPPLAWDDIDDPNAVPTLGEYRPVRFDERYREMRDLGLSHTEIAERLHISGDSLARQMARYNIDTTGMVA